LQLALFLCKQIPCQYEKISHLQQLRFKREITSIRITFENNFFAHNTVLLLICNITSKIRAKIKNEQKTTPLKSFSAQKLKDCVLIFT
jgi:hypothetical protein